MQVRIRKNLRKSGEAKTKRKKKKPLVIKIEKCERNY